MQTRNFRKSKGGDFLTKAKKEIVEIQQGAKNMEISIPGTWYGMF